MDESVSRVDTLPPSDYHGYSRIAVEAELDFYDGIKPYSGRLQFCPETLGMVHHIETLEKLSYD